jgi:hypothetical protein
VVRACVWRPLVLLLLLLPSAEATKAAAPIVLVQHHAQQAAAVQQHGLQAAQAQLVRGHVLCAPALIHHVDRH